MKLNRPVDVEMYSNGFPTKPHAWAARLLVGAMVIGSGSSSIEVYRGRIRSLLLDGMSIPGFERTVLWHEYRVRLDCFACAWAVIWSKNSWPGALVAGQFSMPSASMRFRLRDCRIRIVTIFAKRGIAVFVLIVDGPKDSSKSAADYRDGEEPGRVDMVVWRGAQGIFCTL